MRAEQGGETYVIHAVETQFVKIGQARSVQRRLSELLVGCPYNLRLLKTFKPHEWTEAELHEKFAGAHVRGEWFWLSQDVRDLLARHGVTVENAGPPQELLERLERAERELARVKTEFRALRALLLLGIPETQRKEIARIGAAMPQPFSVMAEILESALSGDSLKNASTAGEN